MSAARLRGHGGLVIACMGLLAALALPPIPLQRRVLEAVAVVDITQSMNTRDGAEGQASGAAVSRLTWVKQTLAQTVRGLPCGSQLGLGVFTAYRSFLLFAPVEICANRREIEDAIAHLDGRMAWAGDSEVAKGVFSALRLAQDLPDAPAIAFFTDGQEAPPINPAHRPSFGGDLRSVQGVIIGVGGATPRPIPKFDPEGRPIGVWQPHEVMQLDPWTMGRQGSVDSEAMAPESEPAAPLPRALKGAPGGEHLSALREEYLRLLAAEMHLGYGRLHSVPELTAALTDSSMTRPRQVPSDLRWLAGLLALGGIMYQYSIRSWSRV